MITPLKTSNALRYTLQRWVNIITFGISTLYCSWSQSFTRF